MDFNFNVYSTSLMMSGVAALLVSLILFQRRRRSIFWFALMMGGSAIWAIAYSFELASATLDQMLFFINIEYIGISLMPALWIMFVIHFIERKEMLTPIRLILIFIFPILTMLFVWTSEFHSIHYQSTSIDTTGPFPLLSIQPGVWYRVHTIYFYVLLGLGMVLLGRYYKQSSAIYKKQTLIVLVGAVVPWATNFLYLMGLRPHVHIDLTPYAFILTATVIAFGLTRYRLFDIVPFAREKLIEKLHEGMLVLDEHGRIVDMNAPVQKFLMSYSQKLHGKKLSEIISGQFAIQHLILKQWTGREEITLSTENGTRTYEVSATPLYDDDKRFVGTLLIMWDITNRKKTTDLLQQQAIQLQELNDIKNKMFTIISHDLKSPMAGLVNILELAQMEAFTEDQFKKLLPLLSKNVDNTKILLDNLLLWAKSQLHGEQLNAESFSLKEVVGQTTRLFEKRLGEKGIRLTDRVKPSTILFADRNMIDLVVRNLVANAIKFCDKNDEILIVADEGAGYTTISIQDSGLGMDEVTTANIFSITPVKVRGTRNESGTGLGLKLCKDFIEKNGGTISVKSLKDTGSTFFFTVPNGKA